MTQISQSDRDLRHQIRKLQYAAQYDRDDLTKVGNPKLLDILEQAGQLQAQVSRPREQALDSELFHNLAECGREMAKRLVNGTQSVSASDFVRRLQHVFSRNDDVCFQSLAVEHHQVLPVVSGICCMLGPLESCPQARKERAAPQRTRRAPPAPVVVPTQQLVVDEEGRQDTDKHVTAMWTLINHLTRRNTPIYFAPLVLSHDSFAHTIENVFALSFLVRDGRVRYKRAPQGLQVVPVSRGEGAATCTAHLQRRQFVMTITFDDWERMRAAVPRDACWTSSRAGGASVGGASVGGAGGNPLTVVNCTVKQEGGSSVQKGGRSSTRKGSARRARGEQGSKENAPPTKRAAR